MIDCTFCGIVAGELPASVIHEDDVFVAFMDIYPWRPGHALVVPRAHHLRVAELGPGVAEALFGLGVRLAGGLRDALGCDDVHFVVNDGPAANQTVPHVHLHLVPRRRNDLWALASNLLTRPLRPLMPPVPRPRLDAQAAAIRRRLP